MTRLILPPPPSANRYWRKWRGRMVVSDEARTYKEECGWIAKALRVEPIAGPVSLRMAVYRPAKRGDLDNAIKVVLDSLNGILYEDDSQIVEIHALRYDDKHKPRVEIEVKEQS